MLFHAVEPRVLILNHIVRVPACLGAAISNMADPPPKISVKNELIGLIITLPPLYGVCN